MNLTDLTNNNQVNLYGHTDIFNELSILYNAKKLPKKIILSGPKGVGKSTLAYHLINFIFSKNEENYYDLSKLVINKLNRSFNLVKNNSHPNFYLIDVFQEKKNIEINQIRDMINFCNKSSFNNGEKIILIDNVDKLNKNSLNALLKIIEEPNSSIFFILILDSNKHILDTLRSRCVKFNLFLPYKKSIEVANKITNLNILDLINSDLLHYYASPGHYVELINFAHKNEIDLKDISLKFFLLHLIDNSYYKKNTFINNYIYEYLEFYLLKLLNENNSQKVNLIYKKLVERVANMKNYNLDQESFFIEIKMKIFNA